MKVNTTSSATYGKKKIEKNAEDHLLYVEL